MGWGRVKWAGEGGTGRQHVKGGQNRSEKEAGSGTVATRDRG